jgi:hypothetical protein
LQRIFSFYLQSLNLLPPGLRAFRLLPWRSKEAGATTAPSPTVFFQAWKRCMFGGTELPVEPLKLTRPFAFGIEVGGKTSEDLP